MSQPPNTSNVHNFGNYKEVHSNGFAFKLFEGDGLARNLFEGKLWEPHFLDIATRLISPGQVVCDAGANFGYHSMHLSRLVGASGWVYSFEPQRIVFQQLCFHLFLNTISNVKAYPAALGASVGFTQVGELGEVDLSNIGATPIGKGSHQVEVLTLDSFYEREHFDFIKLDVQGSETAFLKGATSCIQRDRPLLFIEIEEPWLRDLGSSSKELIEKVFAAGYSLLRIDTEWPCDHLCFPRGRKDEMLERLRGLNFPLTLLEGSSIELSFSGLPYYESFRIT